jgi:subtilisin family serine protease
LTRAAAVIALALALAAPAHAARFAVGVRDGVPLASVAAKLPGRTSYRLAPLHVLVVDAPSVRGVRRIPGVTYVEWLGTRRRRVSFTPNDPLAPRQWYINQDHAFDAWPDPPALTPVRVAVIDSGIDASHPEFAGRVLLTRSFVGGSVNDQLGHGTFVAGEIAAALNNSAGIAGIAFPAQLLVAKIVREDGSIAIEGEAEAIRWAVDNGARVINLSLGGLRDPRSPKLDTFSPLEAAAVAYAVKRGVVLVAAVGNSDEAPSAPWPYASYPAALPHVVGVSALARDGSVPQFSDRDAVYNDVAAPGQDILSTFPRQLTRAFPTCADQGYSDCGPDEYRHAEGTSFAAPQVAAAAALLLAVDPALGAAQVSAIVERTADDANASSGCQHCPLLRDALTGWGRLDVTKAIAALGGQLPAADHYETNDDVFEAPKLAPPRGSLTATLDYWDDQRDVYRLKVRGGTVLRFAVQGATRNPIVLALWTPKTASVVGVKSRKLRVAQSQTGPRELLRYRVLKGRGGSYAVEVRLAGAGSGAYTLTWSVA